MITLSDELQERLADFDHEEATAYVDEFMNKWMIMEGEAVYLTYNCALAFHVLQSIQVANLVEHGIDTEKLNMLLGYVGGALIAESILNQEEE